ncbi:MAG: hypothetical protein L0G96_20660, partial [Acinetobacter sp.]|nr:hypothetical protein [Acinetobacter sp.]
SGQIKLLDPNAAPISPASRGVPNDQAVMPTSPQSEAPVQQAAPDTTVQQQVAATPTEQHPLAPNAELSAQQAEAALNDAVAPTVNTDMNAAPAAAPPLDSSAEAPVNAVEPDSLPSPDAPAQAMPEAPVNDPMN